MSLRTSQWPAGVPCWADLTAPDMDAAKAFYADVLGWDFIQFGEEYGGYAIAQVRGAAVAGIGPHQSAHPSAWTMYFAGDDVDAIAAAITAEGGMLTLAPGDVGPMGRMCLALDPTGAAFGVWQAGQHFGAGLVNEPGGLTWEDLRSTDPDAARAFYRAVFGFVTNPLDMAGPDYQTFHSAEGQPPLGGMGGMMGGLEGIDGIPSHWLLYFAVADAAAAAEAAGKRGGGVVAQPFQTPFGTMAGFTDPGGALFWVVQRPDGAREPDRAG